MFRANGQTFGRPEDDEFGSLRTRDERDIKLNQLVHKEGFRFSYEYDFGDGWQHTLVVERILPAKKGTRYPFCVEGRRACPPEDVGGIWGYAQFLEALADPNHPEHEEYLEWAGGAFDPDGFELDDINKRLKLVGKRTWTGREIMIGSDTGVGAESQPLFDRARCEQLFTPHNEAHAETLALRRDAVSLITYVRDNKVTGTSSTGNLTLKAVAEIAARFVNPPRLETKIGDHVFRFRSEDDVWPIYFVHVLAAIADLIRGGQGRRWRLTQAGEDFLAAPALVQAWILFAAWWTRANWLIAFPLEAMTEEVMIGFEDNVRKLLLRCPPDTAVEFESFADSLIQTAGWTWPIEDQGHARRMLHSAVKRMVVGPLVDFGAVSARYETDSAGAWPVDELVALHLTPFGRALLKTLD